MPWCTYNKNMALTIIKHHVREDRLRCLAQPSSNLQKTSLRHSTNMKYGSQKITWFLANWVYDILCSNVCSLDDIGTTKNVGTYNNHNLQTNSYMIFAQSSHLVVCFSPNLSPVNPLHTDRNRQPIVFLCSKGSRKLQKTNKNRMKWSLDNRLQMTMSNKNGL